MPYQINQIDCRLLVEQVMVTNNLYTEFLLFPGYVVS